MIPRSKHINLMLLLPYPLSAFCCLLLLCHLVAGCGKKGDPTLKAFEKPQAPSSLNAIHRESEIIISWDFPKSGEQGIKGFHVMKSSDNDFREIAFTEKDKRLYTDGDFHLNTVYHYKILSENLRGITHDSVILSVEPLPPPPPPRDLSFEVHHETITIRWKHANEKISFTVYRSDRRGQYGLTPLNAEPVHDTSFQDTFDVNRTVYYTVRSTTGSAIRDEGPSSAELEINPFEFVPSAPEDLTAVATQDRTYLIWKEPPETWVTGYRVYRQLDTEGDYLLVGSTDTPTFTDREHIAGKRNYRVTARGPSKEGPPAEIRGVRFAPPR